MSLGEWGQSHRVTSVIMCHDVHKLATNILWRSISTSNKWWIQHNGWAKSEPAAGCCHLVNTTEAEA